MGILTCCIAGCVTRHLCKADMHRVLPPERDPVGVVSALAPNVVETLAASILQAVTEHEHADVQDIAEVLHIKLISPVPVSELRELILHHGAKRRQLAVALVHDDDALFADSAARASLGARDA